MKSFAAILVLLALAGCSTNSRTPEFKPGDATVRSVHGDVQYGNGGVWNRLHMNMDLTNGVQIRTGDESETYFRIGFSATLKLSADSELDLASMLVQHRLFEANESAATRTVLELRKGTVLGSVRKLSPESSFQIRGGGVTVEVRGGDFHMSADGRVEAVTSVNGAVTAQAGGKTYELQSGQSFDPKKNEIGMLPIIIDTPVTNSPDDYFAHLLLPESWSSSLSPFDRGLENARHGVPQY